MLPEICHNKIIWLAFYYCKERYVFEDSGLYQVENHWKFMTYASKSDHTSYVRNKNLVNRK